MLTGAFPPKKSSSAPLQKQMQGGVCIATVMGTHPDKWRVDELCIFIYCL